jgi:hypothetical protein
MQWRSEAVAAPSEGAEAGPCGQRDRFARGRAKRRKKKKEKGKKKKKKKKKKETIWDLPTHLRPPYPWLICGQLSLSCIDSPRAFRCNSYFLSKILPATLAGRKIFARVERVRKTELLKLSWGENGWKRAE